MNSYYKVLRSLPGATLVQSGATTALTVTEAALRRKLRADRWPFVGVRCVSFILADGTRYTPTVVTVDDGVVTCWEPARETAPAAQQWPISTSPTLYCVVVEQLGRGWLETDVVPTSDLGCLAAKLAAARPTLERMNGHSFTDWDLRDWALDAIHAMQRRCARLKNAHTDTPRAPDPSAFVISSPEAA